jgi:hypothetical protein
MLLHMPNDLCEHDKSSCASSSRGAVLAMQIPILLPKLERHLLVSLFRCLIIFTIEMPNHIPATDASLCRVIHPPLILTKYHSTLVALYTSQRMTPGISPSCVPFDVLPNNLSPDFPDPEPLSLVFLFFLGFGLGP